MHSVSNDREQSDMLAFAVCLKLASQEKPCPHVQKQNSKPASLVTKPLQVGHFKRTKLGSPFVASGLA